MEISIYKHTNKTNGMVYIGQTKQKPEKRWLNGNGYSANTPFGKAIAEFGWDNFEHEIIEVLDNPEEADERERYWIKHYHSWVQDPQCNGYNALEGFFFPYERKTTIIITERETMNGFLMCCYNNSDKNKFAIYKKESNQVIIRDLYYDINFIYTLAENEKYTKVPYSDTIPIMELKIVSRLD